jgi:hypothetical protein
MPDGINPQGVLVMHAAPLVPNPFALLTDPEAIFRAVEASPRLEGLNRRICRPLDRAHRGDGPSDGHDVAADDAVLERESDRRID